jgi:hypothetical protein
MSNDPIAVRALAISVALATLAMNAFTSVDAAAEEKFQKLSGSRIRARLIGMEITDEVHWADVFAANGTLTSYSMGRKTIGKWNVQKDELCVDRGKDDGGCYQVWLAGKKVELRREGSKLPLEGVLQKQSVRR